MAFSSCLIRYRVLKTLEMEKSMIYEFGRRAAARCSVFLIVVVLSSACHGAAAEGQADPAVLTLGRIFTDEEFETEDFGPAKWMDYGSGYTTLEDSPDREDGKDIVRYDPETSERKIFVASARLIPQGQSQPLEIEDYSWSNDGRKLLVFTNTQRVWRTNTRGDYWVLNSETSELRKLGGDAEPSTLMFAKFSPDGDRVAYVRRMNIYVEDLDPPTAGRIRQLTKGGGGNIINGTSDWVYEEEFSLRDGFRWSPDGRYIAYWQFDTEGVGEFHLINYTDSLYPKITSFQYPKVGQTNPACRIGVISSGGCRTRWFEPAGDPRDHYIPTMQWLDDSKTIVFQRLNRLQNTNEVTLGDARTGRMHKILIERDEAWLDVADDLKWLEDARSFTWLSERDGWRRLYLVCELGSRLTCLTPGQFDVINVQSVDEDDGWVYYIASPENPTQRYLYRSPLDGSGKVERVTPSGQDGTHSYQVCDDSKWAFHTYSSFGVPPTIELIRLPEHQSVRTLVENLDLREKLDKIESGGDEFFRVDIGEGVLLDGWCIKPPDFDPEKKYPLLFYVYGEPAGQTVLDKWGGQKYLWHKMLAQQGYVVMSVDNRGTPAPRGRQWRKCVYRRIGILASADQAAAVRAIVKTRPYVDADRIAIWGWSGGGSMSLNAIFRYPQLYHTAIAIAFISDQRFYDTIYQERYMGLPDDNEEGFKNGSPITFAHRLEGNLLIVHGTGDDNCHYQSCAALINELGKHNRYFSMMAYPNRTHSISEGEGTMRHLYEMLTRYLKDHMPPGPRKSK